MVQRRAPRWTMARSHPNASITTILNELDWCTLEQRRCNSPLLCYTKSATALRQCVTAIRTSRIMETYVQSAKRDANCLMTSHEMRKLFVLKKKILNRWLKFLCVSKSKLQCSANKNRFCWIQTSATSFQKLVQLK